MKPEEKTQQYQTYAKGLETENDLMDALGYITAPRFKFFSESAFKDYFEGRGMTYEEKQDIDDLAMVLGTELDSRRGTTDVVEEVMKTTGKNEQSKLFYDLTKDYVANLDKLETVKTNLEKSIISFYNLIEKSDVNEIDVNAEYLAGFHDCDLFYTFSKNKLIYGLKDNHSSRYPSDENKTKICRFKVTVKKVFDKKLDESDYKINIKYLSAISGFDKKRNMRYNSVENFIEDVKKRMLGNSRRSNLDFNYLKKIIQFPALLVEANQKKQTNEKERITDLLVKLKDATSI